jgi:hypothetical protein
MKIAVIIFIILTLIIIYSEVLTESFETVQKLATDNKMYYVQDYSNNQEAANVLSRLVQNSLNLIDYIASKYPNNQGVKRLKEKFNPDKIREAEHEKDSTSYTINKGEMMHLCLRQKDSNKSIHDDNLLMFVIIHELAHIMSQSIGHNNEFYDNFKFLLRESVKKGIYTPVNFQKTPVNYCGINVTNNPYYG